MEVDKGFKEEEDEGDSYVHFKRKRNESSPRGPPRIKRIVRKVPRSSLAKPDAVQEASSAGEEGSTPFIPPSDPLIISSPILEETEREAEQASGKTVFTLLYMFLFPFHFRG